MDVAMGMTEVEVLGLAEGLSAYLCHEMAGPLGTIAATVELGETAEALTAAREAMDRLRYLRAAWAGRAGPMDAAGFAAAARGLPAGERCRVDTGGVHGLIDAPVARVGLCILPGCVLGLPRGGVIHVAGGPHGLRFEIEGPRAAWPDASPCGVARLARLVAELMHIRVVVETHCVLRLSQAADSQA
jgi:histidine phosphotransferase ChpT